MPGGEREGTRCPPATLSDETLAISSLVAARMASHGQPAPMVQQEGTMRDDGGERSAVAATMGIVVAWNSYMLLDHGIVCSCFQAFGVFGFADA
jgi:hypothetical protein